MIHVAAAFLEISVHVKPFACPSRLREWVVGFSPFAQRSRGTSENHAAGRVMRNEEIPCPAQTSGPHSPHVGVSSEPQASTKIPSPSISTMFGNGAVPPSVIPNLELHGGSLEAVTFPQITRSQLKGIPGPELRPFGP